MISEVDFPQILHSHENQTNEQTARVSMHLDAPCHKYCCFTLRFIFFMRSYDENKTYKTEKRHLHCNRNKMSWSCQVERPIHRVEKKTLHNRTRKIEDRSNRESGKSRILHVFHRHRGNVHSHPPNVVYRRGYKNVLDAKAARISSTSTNSGS